eukprot:TRINITY_DN663_c0_g1_i6.p1 TRINITY_DN663_c0_g1~~TRINITY_DN663_c0_g1_i6.p1  ORF type:complete len:272 (-),score=89.41 TRINITY_DN663_c0_g1_i6:64-879(-)
MQLFVCPPIVTRSAGKAVPAIQKAPCTPGSVPQTPAQTLSLERFPSSAMAAPFFARGVSLGDAPAAAAAPSATDLKQEKGLRLFSSLVSHKVEQKKVTTYSQVADELVAEGSLLPEGPEPVNKNIRRRIYDVLNVLAATNVISKQNKQIHWLGIQSDQELRLQEEKKQSQERLRIKREYLEQLRTRHELYTQLVAKNRKRQQPPLQGAQIHTPFIIINTGHDTKIKCQVNDVKTEYSITLDQNFELHSDLEVLQCMDLCGPPQVQRGDAAL